MNYYNEFDPFAAAWLRQLILLGLIAPGDVDDRSIEDVRPNELTGYTQCHFFAGIGGWSYALRLAGWPDDRPVWTGSCPCQPFSAAGKGTGFTDERHLWPAFFHLIQFGKPKGAPVFGEQVGSPDGLKWLDLVHADLQGTGYTFRAEDRCAAGIGAPHIRQRLYWMANRQHSERWAQREEYSGPPLWPGSGGSGDTGIVANMPSERSLSGAHGRIHSSQEGSRPRNAEPQRLSTTGILGDTILKGLEGHAGDGDNCDKPRRLYQGESGSATETGTVDGLEHSPSDGWEQRGTESSGGSTLSGCGASERTGATNGFWRDADWLHCRDGRWRPVEPGTFPLADGLPNRVGMLRGYGNAIVPQVAAEFIKDMGL